MSRTRALEFLASSGVAYEVHHYKAEISERRYGEAVAAALGVEPARVFKTLIATIDGAPTVAIVPVDSQLSLKLLASAANGKKAVMAAQADAERWTGYLVGGISPFGQKRRLPIFLDESAMANRTIYVSAGQRGLQVEVDPKVIADLQQATVASLV